MPALSVGCAPAQDASHQMDRVENGSRQSQMTEGHMGMHLGMAQDPGTIQWEDGRDDTKGDYEASFALPEGVSC